MSAKRVRRKNPIRASISWTLEQDSKSEKKQATLKSDFALPDISESDGLVCSPPEESEVACNTVEYNELSVQAGGHVRSFFEGGHAMPGKLLKKCDDVELACYRAFAFRDDSFQQCAPRFFGVTKGNLERPDGESTSASESEHQKAYVILENLLEGRTRPLVMDCKIGVRSFQEKECASKKPRQDLYKRLNKIGPQYLTEDEHQSGSITKHKWMSTRDAMSSLRSLGFRVDGIAGPEGLIRGADYFANISERDKVIQELDQFLDFLPLQRSSAATPLDIKRIHGDMTPKPKIRREALQTLKMRLQVAQQVTARLSQLHAACKQSPFVASHEFVGVSLLIVVDVEKRAPNVTVHMIDFAKTTPLPNGTTIDHNGEWQLGNHEDGLLFGLIECKRCWDEVIESLQVEISTREQHDRGDGILRWLARRCSNCVFSPAMLVANR